MSPAPRAFWSSAALVLATLARAQQGESVLQTRHNLSVSGLGEFRAQSAGDACIFCHAPHRSRLQVPLWNREDSVTNYLTYQSSTFQGTVGQPNGTSVLCLSCHDGTIALGRVVSLPQEIAMQPGRQFLNTGRGFLGANLRDDHPVSFSYTSSRGGTGVGFRRASAITPPVHLDADGLVQCTSCHDPHRNVYGDFLHTTDLQSAICLACHDPVDWVQASHAQSQATWNRLGTNPWPTARYTNVRDNGCRNCHEQHGAGQPQRLLQSAIEEDNCLRCHNGNVAARNIASDLAKASAHSAAATLGVHDPTENPLLMPRHAECQDCHDSHRARAGTAPAPGVPGPLLGVAGINGSGSVVNPIANGFELCFRCHADAHGTAAWVPRQIQQLNTRLEFDPTGPSFHPVQAPGRNPDVPSLLPPWTTASRVACTDCHASDAAPNFGGTGARGPHGSAFRPILGARYDITDNIAESSTVYALCYRCHNRSSILGDVTFKEHKKHIVEERAPCSVCHDAHGISSSQGNSLNNTHLINFNAAIVFPNQRGQREFLDQGFRRGACNLLCHGKNHENENY